MSDKPAPVQIPLESLSRFLDPKLETFARVELSDGTSRTFQMTRDQLLLECVKALVKRQAGLEKRIELLQSAAEEMVQGYGMLLELLKPPTP